MRQLDVHLSACAARQAETWPLDPGPLAPGPLAPGSWQTRRHRWEKIYELEEAAAECLNTDAPGSAARRQVLRLGRTRPDSAARSSCSWVRAFRRMRAQQDVCIE